METKEQAIARIALTLDFTEGKAGRSILAALSAAHSAGFEAGWTVCNEHHAKAVQMIEEALANRRTPARREG